MLRSSSWPCSAEIDRTHPHVFIAAASRTCRSKAISAKIAQVSAQRPKSLPKCAVAQGPRFMHGTRCPQLAQAIGSDLWRCAGVTLRLCCWPWQLFAWQRPGFRKLKAPRPSCPVFIFGDSLGQARKSLACLPVVHTHVPELVEVSSAGDTTHMASLGTATQSMSVTMKFQPR